MSAECVRKGTVQAGKITHLRAIKVARESFRVRRMHSMRILLASDGRRDTATAHASNASGHARSLTLKVGDGVRIERDRF